MSNKPHKDKLLAAINNPKANNDIDILNEAYSQYQNWISNLNSLTETGNSRIDKMTKLLNEYKDVIEVELIAQRGSAFIKRQKGQLKLDNSIYGRIFNTPDTTRNIAEFTSI